MGKFDAFKSSYCFNLYMHGLVSAQNVIVREIEINKQEVNCLMFAHEGDNEGHLPFWSRLVAIKSIFITYDIMDKLVEEFHVSQQLEKNIVGLLPLSTVILWILFPCMVMTTE